MLPRHKVCWEISTC